MWRLANKPFRKPIAWLSFAFIAFVTLYCLKMYGDVPPGAVTVLMGLVAIPCTVVGSSSLEAIKAPREEKQEEHEEHE